MLLQPITSEFTSILTNEMGTDLMLCNILLQTTGDLPHGN